MKIFKLIFSILILQTLLSSCSPKIYTEYRAPHSSKLAIFMDGTNNKPQIKTPSKNSNIRRLFMLNKPGINSFYVEGVGTNTKLLGLGLSLGMESRIIKAYRYLSENYQKGDSVYLFGFSRGAYGARILSNMIYTTGIIDLEGLTEKEKNKIIKKLYRKYRGRHTTLQRKRKIKKYINHWKKKHVDHKLLSKTDSTFKIEAMGLFESIEAFGLPDYKQNFTNPNQRHLNQIDNIKKVYHAVALDDNRAQIYTPILLTTPIVAGSTDRKLDEIVDEVWFSGSHSDIGGSHKENHQISYTALNWMLSNMKSEKIFRDTIFSENNSMALHNMRKLKSGFKFWTKDINRSIIEYHFTTKNVYNNGKIKIHNSVIERFKKIGPPEFKYSKKRKDWYNLHPFTKCFKIVNKYSLIYKKCDYIQVVYNKD